MIERARAAVRPREKKIGFWGGEEIPPKTLFFSVFSRVLGALRGTHGAGCEDFLGFFFWSEFFKVCFLGWFF